MARLNLDGTFDAGFDPGDGVFDFYESDQSTSAILALPDGSVLVGGSFVRFDGVPRSSLVRLHGDPPLWLSSIAAAANGSVLLNLRTLPGRRYVVESSIDLRDWLPLRINAAAGYVLTFEYSDAANFPRHFYRARLSQ